MPERVVFDTNIWISGLLWLGKPYRCLLLARGMAVQHIHCTEMVTELSEKLRETLAFPRIIYELCYMTFGASLSRLISLVISVVDDDPNDDKFAECALVAGAAAIVSGDHHLLELGGYEEIPILSAAEFLARFT